MSRQRKVVHEKKLKRLFVCALTSLWGHDCDEKIIKKAKNYERRWVEIKKLFVASSEWRDFTDNDEWCLITSTNVTNYFFPLSDEAHYKKFDEYAPKDTKSTATKKTAETNNSQSSKNANVKNSKRSNLKKRSDKTNYSHNWLLTTLKGHTGTVLDMSFSANGKYLATCADGEFKRIFFSFCKSLTKSLTGVYERDSLISAFCWSQIM